MMNYWFSSSSMDCDEPTETATTSPGDARTPVLSATRHCGTGIGRKRSRDSSRGDSLHSENHFMSSLSGNTFSRRNASSVRLAGAEDDSDCVLLPGGRYLDELEGTSGDAELTHAVERSVEIQWKKRRIDSSNEEGLRGRAAGWESLKAITPTDSKRTQYRCDTCADGVGGCESDIGTRGSPGVLQCSGSDEEPDESADSGCDASEVGESIPDEASWSRYRNRARRLRASRDRVSSILSRAASNDELPHVLAQLLQPAGRYAVAGNHEQAGRGATSQSGNTVVSEPQVAPPQPEGTEKNGDERQRLEGPPVAAPSQPAEVPLAQLSSGISGNGGKASTSSSSEVAREAKTAQAFAGNCSSSSASSRAASTSRGTSAGSGKAIRPSRPMGSKVDNATRSACKSGDAGRQIAADCEQADADCQVAAKHTHSPQAASIYPRTRLGMKRSREEPDDKDDDKGGASGTAAGYDPEDTRNPKRARAQSEKQALESELAYQRHRGDKYLALLGRACKMYCDRRAETLQAVERAQRAEAEAEAQRARAEAAEAQAYRTLQSLSNLLRARIRRDARAEDGAAEGHHDQLNRRKDPDSDGDHGHRGGPNGRTSRSRRRGLQSVLAAVPRYGSAS